MEKEAGVEMRGIVGCHMTVGKANLSNLQLVWELLRSGEHGSETWELHQGGATISDTFLWAEGVPGGQVHQHMCAQYGDNALSRRVVYEWIEMFKNGCTSVTVRSARDIRPQPNRTEWRKI
jgi:hypothetical protein